MNLRRSHRSRSPMPRGLGRTSLDSYIAGMPAERKHYAVAPEAVNPLRHLSSVSSSFYNGRLPQQYRPRLSSPQISWPDYEPYKPSISLPGHTPTRSLFPRLRDDTTAVFIEPESQDVSVLPGKPQHNQLNVMREQYQQHCAEMDALKMFDRVMATSLDDYGRFLFPARHPTLPDEDTLNKAITQLRQTLPKEGLCDECFSERKDNEETESKANSQESQFA